MKTKEVLEHYGTKGMKWGVRKKPGSGVKRKAASKASAKSTKVKKGAEGSKKYKKSSAKSLSNKELQTRVSRLNMEKQYKTLLTPKTQKGSISRGAGFVGGILKSSGRKALGKYVAAEFLGQLKKHRPITGSAEALARTRT